MCAYKWTIASAALGILLLLGACGNDGDVSGPVILSDVGDQDSEPAFVVFASVVVLDPEERAPVTSVVISPREVAVYPGQEVILGAIAYDSAGAPVSGVRFQWRVTDPRVGIVNDSGLFVAGFSLGTYLEALELTAIQELGEETISVSTKASVDIREDTYQRVLNFVGVYPSQVTLRPGQFIGLGALGWDVQGRFIPSLKFEWSVEDPRAGHIDEFGFFTAGEDTGNHPNVIRVVAIQSTPQGDVVREGFVSVNIGQEAPGGVLSNVEVLPDSVFLKPGEEMVFSARAFDDNGRPVRDVDFRWIVDDPRIGVIDDTGKLVAGPEAGRYPAAVRVIGTQVLPDEQVSAGADADVTVVESEHPGMLASAHILPSSVDLKPGQRFIFTMTALDQNSNEVGGVSAAWNVVDSRVGSIDQFGVLTAGDEAGIYTDAVRVQVANGKGFDGEAAVAHATVGIIGDLGGVEVLPIRAILRPGQSVLFEIKGYDVNGLSVAPLRGSWSVEDSRAGNIDSIGLFTAGDEPGEYVNAIKVTIVEREN